MKVWAALLTVAALGRAEMPLSAFRGERLRFEVRWAGMVVGHANLDCLPTNEPGLLAIRTSSHAAKAIQSIYPVRDTIQSVADAATGLPVQFRKLQREGNYAADFRIDFRRSQSLAYISGAAKGKPRPDTTISLQGDEFDLLTAYMRVRGWDLEPGKSRHLSLVDNRHRFGSVEIRCLRRDTIPSDTGKIRTIVVEPKIHGDALFAAKGRLFIWFTDDAWHIPVRMESKIALGTIKAYLVSRQAP